MTPQEYVEQIKLLVASGQDQQALDFSAKYHQLVEEDLSNADLHRVDGMLEGAAMAVSLEAWATASPTSAADEAAEPRPVEAWAPRRPRS